MRTLTNGLYLPVFVLALIIFLGDLKKVPLPFNQRSVQQWFNVDAGFERDSTKQLANNIVTLSPRFSGIRGDGLNWWNLSFIKDTAIREGLKLQFRAEAANVFNHPKFGAPNTTPSSTSFGQVTAIGQAPRTIQFGLKILF